MVINICYILFTCHSFNYKIENILLSVNIFSDFFKQFFNDESKMNDINQMLSVAQQINKLGQGK